MVRSNSAGSNQIYTAIINGKEMIFSEKEGRVGGRGGGEGGREGVRVVTRGEGRHHSMPTTPSNSLSTYERDSRSFSQKDSEFSFQTQSGFNAYMRDRDGGVLSGVGDVRTCSTGWPLAVQVSDVGKPVEHTQGQGQGQGQSVAVHTGEYKGTGEGRRIGIVGEGGEGGEGDTTSGFSSSPGITTDSDVSSERQISSGDGDNEDREEDGDRGGGGGGEGESRGTEEGDEDVEAISTVTKNGKDRGLVASNSLLTAKQSENLSSSSKGAIKKNKQQKKKTQKK